MRLLKQASHIPRSHLLVLGLMFPLMLGIGLLKHRNNYVGHWRCVVWSDASGYFSYMPWLVAAGGDATLLNPAYSDSLGAGFQIVADSLTGGRTVMRTKYTIGASYFMAPAYIGTFIVQTILGADTSGFSYTLLKSVVLSGSFWCWVGLLALYTLLSRHFNRNVSLISVVCIFLGTNVIYYASIASAYSHIYGFATLSLFILVYDRALAKPNAKLFTLLGLLGGLALIVRPLNGFTLLAIIIFYQVESMDSFKKRFIFLRSKWKEIFYAILCGFAPIIPQLIYYNYAYGSIWVNTYQGEAFSNALTPKITQVLLSPWNGLLPYLPIWGIALMGLFYVTTYKRPTNWLLFSIVFIGFTYINSAWWIPNWGDSFSARNFCDQSPILALLMAPVIDKIYTYWGDENLRVYARLPLLLIIAALCITASLTLGFDVAFNPNVEGRDPNYDWQQYVEILKRFAFY